MQNQMWKEDIKRIKANWFSCYILGKNSKSIHVCLFYFKYITICTVEMGHNRLKKINVSALQKICLTNTHLTIYGLR